jgi:hypothetical protein
MRKILLLTLALFSKSAFANPINSKVCHIYWGLGQNLSPMGNLRVGFSEVEFGLLQGSGIGIVYAHRTSSPFFYEIGPVAAGSGVALLGGGGAEWDVFSNFRLRTDVTVSTDAKYQTSSYVSLGGVLIL